MPLLYDKTQAGGCIRKALLRLVELMDEDCLTSDKAIELLAMAIDDLREAYCHLRWGKEKEVRNAATL